jgi:para-aminobenzoate synthetase component I
MTKERKTAEYPAVPTDQLLAWAMNHNHFLYLSGNGHKPLHGSFPTMLFAGAQSVLKSNNGSFSKLESLIEDQRDWLYGYFSYEIKNEIEELSSSNPVSIPCSHLEFVVPETIITLVDNRMVISSFLEPEAVFKAIQNSPLNAQASVPLQTIPVLKTSKTQYLQNVAKIKNAILEGEFYEMNYCIEFCGQQADFDPLACYLRLNELSPMPFSAFMKSNDLFLMSASPERFLKKSGNHLISQPIKGTMRRSQDTKQDESLRLALANSEKDRAENLMIVDLVRNDLAKSSVPGSVLVDELFGIYSFQQVHQMISTVRSTIRPQMKITDLIKNAFPMGSMTGAPKIRVMEEIELLEDTARGLYSGSVGFLSPDGDFDFNVVIRSVIYSRQSGKLSFHVGSAITVDSDPEIEYAECLLKAGAILKALGISS